MPKIIVDASKCVIATHDHGGYKEGRCLICEQSGWIVEHPFGLPSSSNKNTNSLTHNPGCAVGMALTRNGKWKKDKRNNQET